MSCILYGTNYASDTLTFILCHSETFPSLCDRVYINISIQSYLQRFYSLANQKIIVMNAKEVCVFTLTRCFRFRVLSIGAN